MSSSNQPIQPQSGLDHLVEAATALTQLVRTTPVSMNQGNANSSTSSHGASSNSSTASCSDSNRPTGSINNSNRRDLNQDQKAHQISDDEEVRSDMSRVVQQASLSPPNSSLKAEQQQQQQVSSSSSSLSMPFKPTAENAKEIFPRRLFRILSDKSISDIITWLPHGNAFVILKTDKLAETVLPKYFPESCASAQQLSRAKNSSSSKSQTCKYPSFTRKLNRWGFRQVTRGPDSGAFHHKFFNREEPDNCLKMVCQRSKRRKGDKSSINLRNSNLRPASTIASSSSSQFLGPYSAALRQQPTVVDGSSNNLNNLVMNSNLQPSKGNIHQLQRLDSSQSTMECESDSSVSMNNINMNVNMNSNHNHILALNNMMNNAVKNSTNNQLNGALKQATATLSSNTQNYEDQATIISSPSCNTPPPTSNSQKNNSSNNSLNTSPMSQMIRTVSTNSSSLTQPGTSTSVNLNSNFSFPVFTNNDAQLDPRLLITHNLATTGNMFGAAVAAATSSSTTTPNTNTTSSPSIATNSSTSVLNTANVQQISQQPPVMPNFITFLDTKNAQNNKNNNNSNNQQVQQVQVQPSNKNQNQQTTTQPQPSRTQVQIQNIPKFHAPILPVGASTASITTAPSSIPITTATNFLLPNTINTNSSNSTVISNTSSNSSTRKSSIQQQQLQNNNHQQQQQQSEAELRVANAKTMLYNAYLKALG